MLTLAYILLRKQRGRVEPIGRSYKGLLASVYAACFHLHKLRGRAHGSHVLPDTKLCHAADFFGNDVQMVRPGFGEMRGSDFLEIILISRSKLADTLMNTRLANDIVKVIRSEHQRRVSLLEGMHPEAADDHWLFTDLPFVAELCLMLLVAMRHQVERELVSLAARAADNGKEIIPAQYQKRVKELQHNRRWNWTEINARLKLKSCEGERQIEALRLLANSYKHDPSKKPDEDLLRLLNLETGVTYAPLAESDGLREGLALFIGLERDADYCDIAETFVTIVDRFIEDLQKKSQLSRVRWGAASLTDFAR